MNENEEENQEVVKYPYPKAVVSILAFLLLERFTYNTVLTTLSRYTLNHLLLTEKTAKFIYNTFVVATNLLAILGAFLGDSRIGKFKTAVYLTIIYLIGGVVLITSAVTTEKKPDQIVVTLGLLLTIIGAGSLRPVIIAFAADHLFIPEQSNKLARFFAIFWMFEKTGNMFAFLVMPSIRDIHCMGKSTCFSLLFGVPGILLLIGGIVFLSGSHNYVIVKQEANMIIKMYRCMRFSISQRSKLKGPRMEHWLDYAKEKFGSRHVADLKRFLELIKMFSPLIVYWLAYFTLVNSLSLHASQMNGDFGFMIFCVSELEIMQDLIILILIPVIYFGFYPLMNRKGFLVDMLPKICFGGFMTALAFFISGCIDMQVAKYFPEIPYYTEGQLRLYNTYPCAMTLEAPPYLEKPRILKEGEFYNTGNVKLRYDRTVQFNYSIKGDCFEPKNSSFDFYLEKCVGLYFTKQGAQPFTDVIEKPANGIPHLRQLINCNGFNNTVTVAYRSHDTGITVEKENSNITRILTFTPGKYYIHVEGANGIDGDFKQGGVYALLGVAMSANNYNLKLDEVVQPNKLSMLALLPVALVLSFAEIIVHLTAINMLYIEAPYTMKTILQAYWICEIGLGYLFCVLIDYTFQFSGMITLFAYGTVLFFLFVIFYVATKDYTYKTVPTLF